MQANHFDERRQTRHPRGAATPVNQRRAFTLVELLVVVGIIAVLIAMLLPTLNRAREQARAAKCLSNLRQLAMATMGYCNFNKGFFPGTGGQSNDPNLSPRFSHWVWWFGQPAIDNDPTHWAYIDNSSIQPYIGSKGDAFKALLRCESDDVSSRPVITDLTKQWHYSYSFNFILSDPTKYQSLPWSMPTSIKRFRIHQVRNSSQKIMFVEEDSKSIDDGIWNPFVVDPNVLPLVYYGRGPLPTNNPNMLADRHEISKSKLNIYGRGNVAFCDGHAEVIDRMNAGSRAYHDPLYVSGNPVTIMP